ncbi:thioredoxin-disulfide reductase [Rickettsiales endosymbiont of Stachyamoeba lipophora]|uniref:thioredoxin-disulfide reductase n=1 Tax=Rickettsiales endosymbiont of Stachyamoeba lipophora TaxID=2486578 RepID=UPI000F6557AB|nr:thioredoxin-disulfide reductase [Rickettsiales endosymbiont of Stachyamoeba lipophora]AZL15037.1 thioredoxin-disulfide reductase [Rickettsiales endosymbiont of Stachyamoeba lipophora]
MSDTKQIHSKVLIIGSGPAGYTAAIYAARANLQPTLVRGMQPGGQLTITTEVENYPGFAETIQGPWLMEQMEKQAEHVGTQLITDHIKSVDLLKRPFSALGESGTTYTGDTVIIATGAQAKWLGLESESKFQGFGVSGCATCDGFFYKNKKCIVVGGGNSAVEEALYLTHHASEVVLIHRRDSLRAEKIAQDRLFNHPKIKVIWNSAIEEIVGVEQPFKSVTGVKIKNTQTGEITEITTDGVFVAIGHKPNTDMFKGQLEMDNEGYLITNPGTTYTSIAGIYAAGDVQDKIYRQAVTAAGTGCMAALDAEKYLSNKEVA